MSKYPDRLHERVPRIDHEYTDAPVCPWCGKANHDWWDGTSLKHDGDEEKVWCGWCEQPYSTSMSVSYSFTTAKRDVEQEKRDEEARREKRAQDIAERFEKAGEFPPGTPVRLTDPMYRRRGTTAVVANTERDKTGYVHVQFEDGYETIFSPDSLEKVEE